MRLPLCAALVLGSAACASKVGWAPTEASTCSPKDPARVCSLSAPDYGHTLELGDAELLPGECAALDDRDLNRGQGGLIRVQTRDPRGEGRRRLIRAPKSKVTIVELREDGRIGVVARQACDRSPIDLDLSGDAAARRGRRGRSSAELESPR